MGRLLTAPQRPPSPSGCRFDAHRLHLIAGGAAALWGGKGGPADGGQLTASQRPSWPCLGALATGRAGEHHRFARADQHPTLLPLFPQATTLHRLLLPLGAAHTRLCSTSTRELQGQALQQLKLGPDAVAL